MEYIDTHTHLYDERFDGDRGEAIGRATQAGVSRLFLPATDSASHGALIALAKAYPARCYAMMGFHPTSANDNPRWREELELVARLLDEAPVPFYAIGETGLDLYWSRDFLREQEEALRFQIELALSHDLPIVLHVREAFEETIALLSDYRTRGLRGVFHSFAGTTDHYRRMRTLGDFRFGIGGVVTYKNAKLAPVVAEMELADLVLETDSPYLPPVPHRGERNESAYLPLIATKIAELQGISPETVAQTTTETALRLFRIE
ncbi:MAG: TatD family hydrolase [Rikenellaceae bacterium]|jgi:TatD DNase family protein|nr:TatD family hydrolase [Rikenellaceae bacterium]